MFANTRYSQLISYILNYRRNNTYSSYIQIIEETFLFPLLNSFFIRVKSNRIEFYIVQTGRRGQSARKFFFSV